MARSRAGTGGSRRRSRRGWLLGHVRAAQEGLGHIRENVLASLVSMLVMAVAIGLPATLFALLDNQRALTAQWGSDPSVTVFMHKAISEDAARALGDQLTRRVDIAAVELVSSAQAFEQFRNAVGLHGERDAAPNPLPHVLIITPRTVAWDSDGGSSLVGELESLEEVDSVLVDFAWIERLRALSALATRSLWVLALVLLGATVLIVGNTIRVLVAQQIREIEVLKLVGATDAYVRRPFLYGGALHGLAAGILAVALLEAVFVALSGPINAVASAYRSDFTLASPGIGFVASVVLLSGLTGWSGAWLGTLLSLRRFGPGAAGSEAV